MTVKFKANGLGVTDPQPGGRSSDGPGVLATHGGNRPFACFGVDQLTVYVEPGDEQCTGWTISIGYIYDFDDRVRYSSQDQKTSSNLSSPGTLIGFQELSGQHYAFTVPGGAEKAYIWIRSAQAGTVNIVASTR